MLKIVSQMGFGGAWGEEVGEVLAAVQKGHLQLNGPSAGFLLTAEASRKSASLFQWYQIFETLKPQVCVVCVV